MNRELETAARRQDEMIQLRLTMQTFILGGAVPVLVSALFAAFFPDWQSNNLTVHATLEAVGAACCLLLGLMILALVRHKELVAQYIWLSSGLFAVGVINTAQALLPVGAASLLTESVAMLLGGVLFALVWVPALPSLVAYRKAVPWWILGASFAFAAFAVFNPQSMAEGVGGLRVSEASLVFEGIGGVGFLVASIFFLTMRDKSNLGKASIFSTFALVFGLSGLLPGANLIGEASWWVWQGSRLIACLIAVSYFLSVFRGILNRFEEQREHLQSAVRERTSALTRQTEDLVRKTEQVESLSQAMEQSAQMFMITDAVGTITYANESFCRRTGYALSELVGKDPMIVRSRRTPDETYKESWAKLARGDVWSGELRIRRKSGQDFWASIIITPLKSSDGKIVGYSASHEDITQRKIAEKQLERAKKKAVSANQAKSDFLSNMSHEIRTPMNGIMMSLTLALSHKLPKEASDLLGLAQTSANNLLHIINDILDFSKMESGKLDLRRERYSLKLMMDHATQLAKPQAQEKGVLFETDYDPDMPDWVLGDDVRLQQVVNNLLSNALKFTSSGSITLRTRVIAGAGEEQLTVQVVDTGFGIPRSLQGKLFNRFSQIRTKDTDEGGTGLGLAICKQLITLMRGEIGVVSEEGQGSEFWFTIPIERAAEKQATEREVMLPEKTGPLRILVAEDVLINQLLIKKLLMKMGHDCILVSDGQQAVDHILSAEPCDLVLMDNQMPVMRGIEAAAAIRASNHAHANIPIIALTADALDAQKKEFEDAGMDGFVSKPVDSLRLEAEIIRVTMPAAP